MQEQWLQQIQTASNLAELDDLRVHLLGKNGVITQQLKTLGTLSPEERKTKGAEINALKDEIVLAIDKQKETLENQALEQRLSSEKIDISLSARPEPVGKIHLISKVIQDITQYFSQLGFQIFDGPHIETQELNFDALNIPAHHPARQSHDTFYVKESDDILRTQTSPVQIRTLREHKPPIRFLAPGRVFRSDDLDATHTPMFHQIEGVVIEEGIHFGHLKGTLIDFCRWFFEKPDMNLRFRPSFFPFTEPSAEVDISWKNDKWLEVLGCGMIHPTVLRNCGIDPDQFQGFAFGMGVDRFTMLKYGIDDIRSFYNGDTRWLDLYGFGAL
ncbi:MAG: phenylalanine--tRNA ligase subunit alpha [Pseudomonadota bacterium]|jgi:phenylalanyl-tRNA synthetase alpha chain|nr:phenylalanine--tRNA ligase subunit alpha [Alphaproteobacteria bacterium]